eukprot:6529316-Pyramimonas_sp.AAC.2
MPRKSVSHQGFLKVLSCPACLASVGEWGRIHKCARLQTNMRRSFQLHEHAVRAYSSWIAAERESRWEGARELEK